MRQGRDLPGDRAIPGIPGRKRELILVIALTVIAGVLFAGLLDDHDHALLDDAYISFRYAQRWADGAGLTFNDGELVEGFSNPLWTLTLGLGARLGLEPHRTAVPLGALLWIGTVLLTLPLGRAAGLDRGGRGFLTGIVLLDPSLPLWAGSGLEPPLTGFLTTVWLLTALRLTDASALRGLLLGVVTSGLILSRPEGMLWAGVGLAWLLWGAWVPVRVLGGWAAGLLPALGYLGWRWVTYGRLLPNTFHAKLEPSAHPLAHGVEDLVGWLALHAAPLLLVATAGLRRSPPAQRQWFWTVPVGWLLVQALFVLAAGGDWMGRTRYLAPLVPALALLAAWSLEGLLGKRGRARIAAVAVVLAVAVPGMIFRDRLPTYTHHGRDVGRWLASVAEPGDRLAVSAAGAIPYFSGLPTLDVLGITDAEVARTPVRHAGVWAPGHHRYDLERILEARPEWIIWDYGRRINERRIRTYRNWNGPLESLDYRARLFTLEEFQNHYRIETRAPDRIQTAYTIFRRR